MFHKASDSNNSQALLAPLLHDCYSYVPLDPQALIVVVCCACELQPQSHKFYRLHIVLLSVLYCYYTYIQYVYIHTVCITDPLIYNNTVRL